MSGYAERRRQLACEALGTVVFDAAVALLEEGGMQALTMARLAEKAGVSRGTLYNHFRDRDDVLVVIETRLLAPVMEQLQTIESEVERPALERLEALVDTIFATVDSPAAPLLQLLFDMEPEPGRRRDHHIERRVEFRRVVAKVIGHGQESGELRQCSAERMAEMFWGAIDGTFEAMSDEDEIDRPRELSVGPLMELFRHGLSAR